MVKIVGILNVTPDSFSDGSKYVEKDYVLQHVQHMIESGAKIIDIGAESTRPGAIPVGVNEEIKRLELVLEGVVKLAHAKNIQVSVDTYKPEVAEFSIGYGIDFINDVTGFSDINMINVVKRYSHIKLIAMNSLGAPANHKIHIPKNIDPVAHIIEWAKSIILTLEDHGIERNNIIIDPGIGFGKTVKQSWNIINNIEKLHVLDSEIYIGHSRKKFLNFDNINADAYTLAVSTLLAYKEVDYLRVHDVALHNNILSKMLFS